MSEYSDRAISFMQKNYSSIIDEQQYISVSVGGSVARKYAQDESDIDLICITNKEKKYKKIFKRICEFPVEIHIIPVDYIYALVSEVKKYIELDYITPNSIEFFSMGAKKCNVISKKQDELTKFLSNWREIKKISDSIVLKENKFLQELQKAVEYSKLKEELLEVYKNSIKEYSDIDKIINSLKIYSIVKGKIFSKVLWTDIYVEKDYNNLKIKSVLDDITKNKEKLEKGFLEWEAKNYSELIKLHSKINCEFCRDDYLQCNIMRCIHDYIIDMKKAKANSMKYGEVLSIKKALEYIYYLYEKENIIDKELEELDKLIYIDSDKANIIFEIVRKEVEDVYIKQKNEKRMFDL